MSHNKITVNSQAPTSTGDVTMSVSSVVGDTPLTNETIVGNASNQYEFGASPTPPDPLLEYFFVCNTNLGGSLNMSIIEVEQFTMLSRGLFQLDKVEKV